MICLIVDDCDYIRRLISEIIKDLADEIYECGDGADVLQAYAERLPDWVIMDLKMKRVDGLTAARQIKERFPEARIIITTEYKNGGLREAARVAGACGYVHKENLLELREIISG